MTREEILKEIKKYKLSKHSTEILFSRDSHIWWLHRYGYGNVEIELSEYGFGVN